jgi:hypothetical protein
MGCDYVHAGVCSETEGCERDRAFVEKCPRSVVWSGGRMSAEFGDQQSCQRLNLVARASYWPANCWFLRAPEVETNRVGHEPEA